MKLELKMAKLINSHKQPEKLMIDAIRAFTPNDPYRVTINDRHQYLACWAGNFVMWIRILMEKGQYSITIGLTQKTVASCKSLWFDKKPVVKMREAIAFFITDTGFNF